MIGSNFAVGSNELGSAEVMDNLRLFDTCLTTVRQSTTRFFEPQTLIRMTTGKKADIFYLSQKGGMGDFGVEIIPENRSGRYHLE